MKKKTEAELKNNANLADKRMSAMSDFETSRWYALIDAVNMIAGMAEEKRMKFEDVDIKPSAIEHYIESTCDIYCKKIQEENNLQKERTAAKVASEFIKQINKVDTVHV